MAMSRHKITAKPYDKLSLYPSYVSPIIILFTGQHYTEIILTHRCYHSYKLFFTIRLSVALFLSTVCVP